MEALFTAIVLIGCYYMLKAIFIYEMKVANIPVKTQNGTSYVNMETADKNFLYYACYKYPA